MQMHRYRNALTTPGRRTQPGSPKRGEKAKDCLVKDEGWLPSGTLDVIVPSLQTWHAGWML